MDVADKIRKAREAADLSQRDLAQITGVRQPNIAAYESGRRAPSARMVERLLDAARPRPSVALKRERSRVVDVIAKHKAGNVRVFGSVARGTDSRGSDIDFLVTFEPGADLFDLAEMVEELRSLLGVPVDVVSERALRERDEHIRREAVPV